MKLLRIDSSARRQSVSRHLTGHFAEAWQQAHPEGTVIERDLAATSLPLITDEWTQAVHSDPAGHTSEQKRAIEVSDTLIDERSSSLQPAPEAFSTTRKYTSSLRVEALMVPARRPNVSTTRNPTCATFSPSSDLPT